MRSTTSMIRRLARGTILLCLFGTFQSARAGVMVDFDSGTLNNLLAALTRQEIDVPVTKDHSLRVRLDELTLRGFDPTAGENRQGYILTALKLSVPELGLAASIEPRLSLNVIEEADLSVLELRFESVKLPLPLGSLEIARFLPPIRFPADQIYLMKGAAGDVQVRSRLARVRMGSDVLKFEFDVTVLPSSQ